MANLDSVMPWYPEKIYGLPELLVEILWSGKLQDFKS